MKTLLMWLTFVVAILAGLISACAPLARAAGSYDSNFLGALFVLSMFPAMVIGIYVGDCVWLVIWRSMATKKEVERIAFAGPTSRFDRWLVEKLGPRH